MHQHLIQGFHALFHQARSRTLPLKIRELIHLAQGLQQGLDGAFSQHHATPEQTRSPINSKTRFCARLLYRHYRTDLVAELLQNRPGQHSMCTGLLQSGHMAAAGFRLRPLIQGAAHRTCPQPRCPSKLTENHWNQGLKTWTLCSLSWMPGRHQLGSWSHPTNH